MKEQEKIIEYNKIKQQVVEKQQKSDESKEKYKKLTIILLGILIVWCFVNLFLNSLISFLFFLGYAIGSLICIIYIFPKKVKQASEGLEELIQKWKSLELYLLDKEIGKDLEKELKHQVKKGYYLCPDCNSINLIYKKFTFIDKDIIDLFLECECGKQFKETIKVEI